MPRRSIVSRLKVARIGNVASGAKSSPDNARSLARHKNTQLTHYKMLD
jgi:hypothetical protein